MIRIRFVFENLISLYILVNMNSIRIRKYGEI
jgi:hypothetical protein